MNLFEISEHANKRSKNLSGGTKRKLAFCIAILGGPMVALLDGESLSEFFSYLI
jgi:ABC-type multidrug transport system ATPase subunit